MYFGAQEPMKFDSKLIFNQISMSSFKCKWKFHHKPKFILFEFKQVKTLIFKPKVFSKKHWLTSSIKNQHWTTIQKNVNRALLYGIANNTQA